MTQTTSVVAEPHLTPHDITFIIEALELILDGYKSYPDLQDFCVRTEIMKTKLLQIQLTRQLTGGE
jgi:hypothetical protein